MTLTVTATGRGASPVALAVLVPEVTFPMQPEVTMGRGPFATIRSVSLTTGYRAYTERIGGLGGDVPVLLLFPASGDTNPALSSPTSGLLVLSSEVSDELVSFWRASLGFPSSQVPGQLARMMYLSAITITTVGFGDILPLSTPARLAVASEAVLGIVLAGLFLNSLFRPIAAEHPSTARADSTADGSFAQ